MTAPAADLDASDLVARLAEGPHVLRDGDYIEWRGQTYVSLSRHLAEVMEAERRGPRGAAGEPGGVT